MVGNLIKLISFLSLTVLCFGQGHENSNNTHYPRLLSADVPFYPPVAWSMRFGGTVEIQVTVENGVVKNAQLKTSKIEPQAGSDIKYTKAAEDKLMPYLTDPSLNIVKNWKFVSGENGNFLATFIYVLEGEETLVPENPKVEMKLPTLIKVSARPFRPTHSALILSSLRAFSQLHVCSSERALI
jgi:hypothetical protein